MRMTKRIDSGRPAQLFVTGKRHDRFILPPINTKSHQQRHKSKLNPCGFRWSVHFSNPVIHLFACLTPFTHPVCFFVWLLLSRPGPPGRPPNVRLGLAQPRLPVTSLLVSRAHPLGTRIPGPLSHGPALLLTTAVPMLLALIPIMSSPACAPRRSIGGACPHRPARLSTRSSVSTRADLHALFHDGLPGGVCT